VFELVAKYADVYDKHERLKDLHVQSKEELNDLNTSHAILQSERQDIQYNHDILNEKYATLNEIHKETQTKYNKLSQQHAQKADSEARLRENYARMSRKLGNLHGRIKKKFTEVEVEKQGQIDEYAKLNKKHQTLQNKKVELHRQHQILQSKHEKMKSELKDEGRHDISSNHPHVDFSISHVYLHPLTRSSFFHV
jgi:chromosome segregation ATPase